MKLVIVLLLSAGLLVSACTAFPAPSEADIQTAVAETLRALPTPTAFGALTPAPSPTATPTSAPTETPTPLQPSPTATSLGLATATATLLLRQEFAEARIYRVGLLVSGQFLVTLLLSGQPQENYRADVNGEVFKCQVLAQYPDRLYCTGPALPAGKTAVIRVYPQEGEELVFRSDFFVPLPPSSTPTAVNKRATSTLTYRNKP